VAVFVIRRLIVSVFILLISTFVVYLLVANSGDPLGDLRLDTSSGRAAKIAHRIEILDLNTPTPARYVKWLGRAAQCAVPLRGCDLGKSIHDQDVTALLSIAAVSTLRLVGTATVLALLIGVLIGILSALRQYTPFDYTITFSTFLMFSLPIFWIAVLLKQYLAIAVNDWYADPKIGLVSALVLALLSGTIWGAVIGGSTGRRWAVRGIAGGITFGLLLALSAQQWFARPALGPGLITLFSLGAAVAITVLVSGLNHRSVLYSCLATAAVGCIAQFGLTPMIRSSTYASYTNLLLLAVAAALVAAAIGYALGGLDRPQAIRAAILTALVTGSFIVIDAALRAVPGYSGLVNGRLFPTVGSNTPNFSGSFWERLLDTSTHLLLPTLSIMLISFAGYSRYSRATMLEVMNQDYVRTARSKGLTERTVVMRHAFRNALIPLTTVAAVDFGALIGGAIITETVFGWKGMGQLFVQGLLQVDPNPVMGFYIVTAVSIVLFNMLADLTYAYLDPRIRV